VATNEFFPVLLFLWCWSVLRILVAMASDEMWTKECLLALALVFGLAVPIVSHVGTRLWRYVGRLQACRASTCPAASGSGTG
jgi:hypothetical protein